MSAIVNKVGFLVYRSQEKGVAHVWTGTDTACRMWSTGGLKKRRYDYRQSAEGKSICRNCINCLGYNPQDELETPALHFTFAVTAT